MEERGLNHVQKIRKWRAFVKTLMNIRDL